MPKASVGRVTVKTGLLHEVASAFPDGYFSVMVLLDHMDWLGEELVLQEVAAPVHHNPGSSSLPSPRLFLLPRVTLCNRLTAM